MTDNKSDAVETVAKKIEPVRPSDFQTAEHRYSRFDCVVPAGLSSKQLENPDLWVNVSQRLKMFDEVRVIAEDHSFVAYLIVLFSQGADARLKVVHGIDLADIDEPDLPQGKYDVKLCGTKKFCIINMENGDRIKEDIPTKAKAYQELEEYITALRR